MTPLESLETVHSWMLEFERSHGLGAILQWTEIMALLATVRMELKNDHP